MKRVLVTGIELIVEVPDDWDRDQVQDKIHDATYVLSNADSDVDVIGIDDLKDSDIEEIAE